jgi:hypothetical protein
MPSRVRTRLILALVTLGLLVAAMPAVASARVDDWARVVRSRHAGAAFTQLNGCEQVEVHVSAMDGKFVNRHGAVNKQGLLGVLFLVRDACAEPGPKGFPIVYSADGMTLDRLRSAPRFSTAWIDAALPGIDGDGNAVDIRIDLRWQPLAKFERSRVSGHAWFPPDEGRGARVGTFSHNMSAPASARGTIRVGDREITLLATTDATLEQVRYLCMVNQHPQGGFDVDC